jgi:hypothetical protein
MARSDHGGTLPIKMATPQQLNHKINKFIKIISLDYISEYCND